MTNREKYIDSMTDKVKIDTIKYMLDTDGCDYDEKEYIIEFIKPFTFKPFGKDKLETQFEGWCFTATTRKKKDVIIKELTKIKKLSLYSDFEINSYKTSKREIEELKQSKDEK